MFLFSEGQAYQRPKKKPLAERIAEKEAAKKKEDEEKRAKDKVSCEEKSLPTLCYILCHGTSAFLRPLNCLFQE